MKVKKKQILKLIAHKQKSAELIYRMSVDIENLKKEIDVLKDNEKRRYIDTTKITVCEVRHLMNQWMEVIEKRLEEVSKWKPIKPEIKKEKIINE